MLLPNGYLGSLLHMDIKENRCIKATGLDNSGKLNKVFRLLEDANWCPPIVVLDHCLVKEKENKFCTILLQILSRID